ncbi:cupin domain-containing protein [Blastopirellula sp. JC732]|uniref:Cupin domain-containing protein n=1 Tax=Blastopirellula sediminis TaxID=2894196 RepID=A0A9X1MSF8_9BACT|nr:cupin domain-containing protein [Blastopirellula sediminis]MCC9604996.1 cupin domain-containing protein [Blastopirellula sediminis]MCC9631704.1 cupin domain-containing protein [Blastopirellula sediminis]
MQHAATIRPEGQGRRVAVVGDAYRLLATGEETGGTYAMMDATVPLGGGPPPHIHRREEEAFYVLEGEITFTLEDEQIIAGPGCFLNMPIGSRHCFKNESDQPARMLITVAPAGLEEMFLEVGQLLASEEDQPQPPTEEDIQKLLEAAPRYGVEILPPPQ